VTPPSIFPSFNFHRKILAKTIWPIFDAERDNSSRRRSIHHGRVPVRSSSGELLTTMKVSTFGIRKELSPVETLRFQIHEFGKLTEAKGESIELPSLPAHGYQWHIRVYPRGHRDSDEEEEAVSVFLRIADPGVDSTVDTQFTFKVGPERHTLAHTFSKNMRGFFNLIERETLHNTADNKFLLPNGTLVIDVDIQVYVELPPVWYPKPITDHSKFLADLLESSCCSDVTFRVGNQDFRLHRNVLASRAPALFQMIDQPDQIIALDDDDDDDFVDADTFRSIVRHIYTGDWPVASAAAVVDADVAAKTMLISSDRFGCTNLKQYYESVIVEKFLNKDNAADMLLLGDSHTCALLKEAALKICHEQAAAVMDTDGWKRVKESSALLEELFAASCHHRQQNNNPADDATEGQSSVAELRDRLLKRGRDVDGSREMLVKRLKAE
jgi:speckle-type POZ protein